MAAVLSCSVAIGSDTLPFTQFAFPGVVVTPLFAGSSSVYSQWLTSGSFLVFSLVQVYGTAVSTSAKSDPPVCGLYWNRRGADAWDEDGHVTARDAR